MRKSKSPNKQQSEQASISDVVSASTEAVNKERKMSDIPSIIEYDVGLDEAEAPVPLPKGDYVGEIRGAEVKTSRNDKPYINVTFIIPADQYPADYTDGNPDGTTLSYGRLSPENNTRARWGMRKFLEATGQELSTKIDLNEWLGKTAKLTIIHEMYEGLPQARISKVGEAA